jgi:predicted aldo/keto reductase-like oxidoreductase
MKKLGFGLMRLPLAAAGSQKAIDWAQVNRMADRFIDTGFTYFDTAYIYHEGESETVARRAIVERHRRDTFTLADKMPLFLVKGESDYRKYFDEQLRRCGVTWFDYYLLHAINTKTYAETEKYGGFDFMQTLKARGEARHIGFSYHDNAALLDEILTRHPEMEFVQLQINYVDWDSEGVQSRKCYEVAVKHNKPVIVMEPVKGGCLANVPEAVEKLFRAHNPGASLASWALRYAASLENVMVVLSGMSDYAQMADNTAFMSDFKPLTSNERDIITQATAIIKSRPTIPCTGCRYCVEGCPQHVPIPEYFDLYNNQKLFKLMPSHLMYYKKLAQQHANASACVACRQCEEHCPQHINIVDSLKEVAAVFER